VIDGRDQGASWEAWLLTEEAKKCMEGSAAGQYLKNRLWWAYMAGWKGAEARRGERP
jgi:hypothetical protein